MRATAGGSGTASDGERRGVRKKTPLILLWAFSTLFWAIFTPPHQTFAARVLLFQPLWLLRIWRADPTWLQDLTLFQVLHTAYSYWSGAWHFPRSGVPGWLDLHNRDVQIYLQVFILLGGCAGLAGTIVYRGKRLDSDEVRPEPTRERRIDEQVLPPLLLPSRTTHSRLFPRKHAFSYAYLFVGIPVGIEGRISTVLSVDCSRRGWFTINSEDYLDRDLVPTRLAEKLKRYLHTQGVTDRDYAFAYLVTAPRFASYSFNPVSFWYLYDSDTKLKWMILEVNNTFDERRMYLLRAGGAMHDSGIDLAPKQGEAEEDTGQLVFTETWEKDFHVSPFNSRKGSYSLKATDPLAAYEQTGRVRIDNTIILRSSQEHAKIVARVFSDGTPRDPSDITTVELARFIASWWWIGFATFPRIAWEASKLFFRRKLHVWYRPEVTETSVGRTYTNDERLLETFFRAFLTKTVTESTKPLRVIYEPAHSANTEIVLYSPDFTYEEDHHRTLTIKVLSPAFYSRFVHYAHAKEAFDRECLVPEEKNRTAMIQRPDLLPALLEVMEDERQAAGKGLRKLGFMERLRWSWLRRLRCPPAAASYLGSSPLRAEYTVSDIRPFPASELDAFVEQNCEDGDEYRRTTIKTFLAERVGLGFPVLLELLDRLLRSAMLLASMLQADRSSAGDVLRPRPLHAGDIPTVALTLLLANFVHLWSLIKG